MPPILPLSRSKAMILPFFVPDIYQGFATANGIAQLNSVGLQLELEVKEHWFGRSRCSIIKMRIPYCEISTVVLRSNWFVTRLMIQTCRVATVSQFPEQESGRITLGIARRDRDVAKSWSRARHPAPYQLNCHTENCCQRQHIVDGNQKELAVSQLHLRFVAIEQNYVEEAVQHTNVMPLLRVVHVSFE